MAILSKGNTYSSGDPVTADNLNALVDSATFVSGSNQTTDNSTLEVHSGGYLQVKDDGITNAKIATGAVNADSIAADAVGNSELADNAVQTANIADSTGASDGVTTAKIATDAVTSAKISSSDSVFSVNNSTNVVGVGGDINISKDSTGTEENIKVTNNHGSAPGECRLQFLAPNASTSVTQGIYGFQPSPGQLSMTISDGSGGFESMAFNSSGNLAVPGTVTANGVVLTSDQTLKQDIESLNEAEGRVAARLKTLIKKFRFIKEVQKGNSKLHIGVNAQEVQSAFQAEGLNSDDYAVVETTGDTLGVRYNELFAFIISAL